MYVCTLVDSVFFQADLITLAPGRFSSCVCGLNKGTTERFFFSGSSHGQLAEPRVDQTTRSGPVHRLGIGEEYVVVWIK